jgi:hypothetical protein
MSRGFLYLSGLTNLIYYSTYNMYIGIYTIYREYMSKVTSLAHLCCGATMARLICVARGTHMWPGPHTARLPQPILGNGWLMHNTRSTLGSA